MASAQKAKEVWIEKRCISFSPPAYGECSKKRKKYGLKNVAFLFHRPHMVSAQKSERSMG